MPVPVVIINSLFASPDKPNEKKKANPEEYAKSQFHAIHAATEILRRDNKTILLSKEFETMGKYQTYDPHYGAEPRYKSQPNAQLKKIFPEGLPKEFSDLTAEQRNYLETHTAQNYLLEYPNMFDTVQTEMEMWTHIPITPQDAKFKHSDCKRLRRKILKKTEEYLLYFEYFLRIFRRKLAARWVFKLRILRCNGYMTIKGITDEIRQHC